MAFCNIFYTPPYRMQGKSKPCLFLPGDAFRPECLTRCFREDLQITYTYLYVKRIYVYIPSIHVYIYFSYILIYVKRIKYNKPVRTILFKIINLMFKI
jgi:hypothetical protein